MRTFAATLLALLAAAGPAHAAPVTLTYSANTTIRVPAGVTAFSVVAIGGHGGGIGSAVGGAGLETHGTLAVTPGEVLTLQFGGGGAGGSAGAKGGNGGGMAAILAGSSYRLVAPGGGGAGATGALAGGNGGDATLPGKGSQGMATTHAKGGGAGTDTGSGAGGAGAVGSSNTGGAGTAGVSGSGGAGGSGNQIVGAGGGGGGGGRWGGGGGGGSSSAVESGAGGGGGAGYVDPAFVSAVTTTSNATNITPQLSVTFTDNVAPAVALPTVSPDGTTLTGSFGVELADLPGEVEFFRGATATGTPLTLTPTVAADGTYSVPLTLLAEGTWTARASQSDLGGSVFGAARTFVIDRTPPAPTPDTTAPNLRIDGTTDDPHDVTLELSDGTRHLAPVTNGTFNPIPSGLADGAYTVNASQADAAGNTATAGPRSFRVDTTAPEIGSDLHASYARGEAVAAPFTCTDAGSGVAACDLPTIDTATAGEHEVTVGARDNAGNTRTLRLRYAVLAPTPLGTPAPTPKASAGLAITAATLKRGKLTVSGTAAGTGTITIKAGKVTKKVKLAKGTFKVTLKAKAIKVTVTYAGDATHLAGKTSLTVR